MTQQVKIIEFESYHLLSIDLQEEQKYFLDCFNDPSQIIEYGESLKLNSTITNDNKPCAWTAIKDNTIIGCGGIINIQGHIGEAWTLLGKDFKRYAHRIAPIIRRQAHMTNLIRIYALVDSDFERAERFLEWVGFEYEGTTKKSGVNLQDQKLYAIVKEI